MVLVSYDHLNPTTTGTSPSYYTDSHSSSNTNMSYPANIDADFHPSGSAAPKETDVDLSPNTLNCAPHFPDKEDRHESAHTSKAKHVQKEAKAAGQRDRTLGRCLSDAAPH